MALNDYDVGLAFARIEDELIASMMRNLKRHLDEEKEEGFDWSQWQVEQLKYLNEYRRRNKKKYGPQFKDINQKMVEAIREAEEQGQKEEELRILQSIADDKKIRRRYANRQPSIEAQGDAFFRTNDKKLEALVEATQNDMQKAEQAVLRRSNDQYRQIIYDAQIYANTGAGTPQKAIDMATKDFLSRGIDSIVYKNGARHTISDYADMYIRTAERRATLMGEGKKRQEWGEQLVIVNKRGGHPCPKCAEWVGKILIDDVYSGGKPDGKHKLLSEAMAEGLYHPRCKDGHTTYIPGISKTPDPVTVKELKEAEKAEAEEAREQLVERQAEKYERLAEYSLDPENKSVYKARAERWAKIAENEKQIDVQSIASAIRRAFADPVEGKKIVGFDQLDDIDRKAFQNGLRKADPIVKDVLRELFRDSDYALGTTINKCVRKKNRSIICLIDGFTPDALAHELFHSLDNANSISSSLEMYLLSDWVELQKKASRHKNVGDYLFSVFPDAFESGTIYSSRKLKDEYRGISDIIDGLTGCSVRLGYGHYPAYWMIKGNVEKEAWAQFGRIYYSNNPEVRTMLTFLFPSFEKEAVSALRGL